MKKTSILLSIFVVLLASHYFLYVKNVQEIQKTIYLEKSVELKNNFKKLVEEKKGKTFSLTYLLSQNPKVINALVKNDNTILDFHNTLDGIQKYGDFKNLWIQIVDKNGVSFYRSWTTKVGDNAALARIDIEQMIKNPKPMQQISTGRFDMTFKTMLPLYDNGNFIGLIEMISHFNSIAEVLKKDTIEPIMLVDESYTKNFIKPLTGLFIGKNYVANNNASRHLMKTIEKNGIDNFLDIKEYILHDKYLVTTYKINNIHNKPMGYFILFFEQKDIEMTLLNEFKITYMKRLLIVITFFGFLVLFYISRKYLKTLNKEVKRKTKKIRSQKENLVSILNIYDKNVIFSKTDLKGYITHVSDAFCKISGYNKEELIGKNHNIIRHPDMPKEAFEYLWSELKQEKKVKLEVKNLKKNGGYYWVDAEFEPEYNKKGIHIGFVAVREDITAIKDIEEIQREIIFTMGSIGESRSKETGNHVKRVAEYSALIALKYGLASSDIEMLRQASPMHDIGKVAIPDSILNKPGKLDKEERTMMETHALKGFEMLKVSQRPLLKAAAITALEHHEKWDGTGYPKGLKGEEIHIFGRITAIADIFDALGSERCYKKAWEDEKIFAFFKEQKGKHFDPKLVDIFFANIEELLKIRDRYNDKFDEQN